MNFRHLLQSQTFLFRKPLAISQHSEQEKKYGKTVDSEPLKVIIQREFQSQ